MPLQLVSRSSPPLGTIRRLLVGAALVAVGYVAALIASPSQELPFGVSIGSAAVKPGATHARHAGSSTAAGSESQPDFDYFPDHYSNQAKEAAEPIETF